MLINIFCLFSYINIIICCALDCKNIGKKKIKNIKNRTKLGWNYNFSDRVCVCMCVLFFVLYSSLLCNGDCGPKAANSVCLERMSNRTICFFFTLSFFMHMRKFSQVDRLAMVGDFICTYQITDIYIYASDEKWHKFYEIPCHIYHFSCQVYGRYIYIQIC